MNIVEIPTLFQKFDLPTFEEFIKDQILEFVREQTNTYLNKYDSFIESYQDILISKQFICKLIQKIFEKEMNEKSINSENLLIQEDLPTLDFTKIQILNKIVYQWYRLLKKKIVQQLVSSSSYILIDFNWNVNVSVSCNNLAKIQIPILLVELILKKPNSYQEKRITLEMTNSELKSFVNDLLEIYQKID